MCYMKQMIANEQVTLCVLGILLCAYKKTTAIAVPTTPCTNCSLCVLFYQASHLEIWGGEGVLCPPNYNLGGLQPMPLIRQ